MEHTYWAITIATFGIALIFLLIAMQEKRDSGGAHEVENRVIIVAAASAVLCWAWPLLVVGFIVVGIIQIVRQVADAWAELNR